MFTGEVHHLGDLRVGDLVGKNATFADSVVVDVQHDSCRALAILVEEALQHMHHEFHRGVVIVKQQHPVKVRPFGLRFRLCDDRGARALVLAALAVVVGEAGAQRRERVGRGEGGLGHGLGKSARGRSGSKSTRKAGLPRRGNPIRP